MRIFYRFSSAMAVRATGITTPIQCLAISEDDVKKFWNEIVSRGDSRPCMVMKPDNSIEGDAVTVCDSEAAAVATFRKIYGQVFMRPQKARVALIPLSRYSLIC